MRRGFTVMDVLVILVLIGSILLCVSTAFTFIQESRGESTEPTAVEPAKPIVDDVKTVRLTEDRLTTDFTRRGVLQPIEQVTVHAESTGRVLEKHVSIGDPVQEGDSIFEVDGNLLKIRLDEAVARQKSAQLSLDEAEAQLADAKQEADDRSDKSADEEKSDKDLQRDLESRRDAARASLELANAQFAEAEQSLEARLIRAPLDGIIAQIWVDKGEFAATGRPVAEIIVTNPMKVVVSLTADEVAHLGGDFKFEVTASQDALLRSARLLRIAPVADSLTRRFSVELEVSNDEHDLRPGMRVDVRFHGVSNERALLLPRKALTRRGNALVCFRVEDSQNGRIARQVEPKLTSIPGKADYLEVRFESGKSDSLRKGDQVAVAGHLMLKDGQLLSR